MLFGNITHKILRAAVALHKTAVRIDCASAHKHADRKFDNAACQLELVNRAKHVLGTMQDEALAARSIAHVHSEKAHVELSGIRVGKTRG